MDAIIYIQDHDLLVTGYNDGHVKCSAVWPIV